MKFVQLAEAQLSASDALEWMDSGRRRLVVGVCLLGLAVHSTCFCHRAIAILLPLLQEQ